MLAKARRSAVELLEQGPRLPVKRLGVRYEAKRDSCEC